MKKILILKPSDTARGGISNYFSVLEKYFTLPVEYFIRGSRNQPHNHSKLYLIVLYGFDLLKFMLKLTFCNYYIVHINTSLGVTGLYRDAAFLQVAKFFNRKVIVFFRGLDQTLVIRLSTDLSPMFKKYFFKADILITLSKSFAAKLIELGYKGAIKVETTIVDDALVPYKTYNEILNKRSAKTNIKLLFLGRIEKEKGIYESILAFQIIKNYYANIELIIAGDGKELSRVKDFVKDKSISQITFTGYVANEQKRDVLYDSSIFLLPSYNEGMPNSVLEAMAFGLPVVATKVGGLPDIINDYENGFLVDNPLPLLIAENIIKLIENETLFSKIVKNNFTAAQDKYLASRVVKRLEAYYNELIP